MRASEKVWRGANARLVGAPLHASVTSLAPGPDHSWLAGDDEGGLWYIRGGQSQRFHLHRGTVNALACLPDLGRAVSGADDESVHHWSWMEGSSAPVSLARHTLHGSYVTDVAMRRDDMLVASVGLDRRLVLSSPSQDTPALIVRLPTPAVSVSFFPSPLPLLLLATASTVSLCDLRMPDRPLMDTAPSLERIWRSEAHHEREVEATGRGEFRVVSDVAVCKDALTQADRAERYDRFTGRYVAPLEPHVRSPLVGAALLSGAVAFLTQTADAHLCVWRTDDGSLLASHRPPALPSLSPSPQVRPVVASHVIATCQSSHVSVHTERAPSLSAGVSLSGLTTRFPVTALALAAPEGPLLVGDAGGQLWLTEPASVLQ